MAKLSPNLNVMFSAVKKAGRSLIHDFNEIEKLQISVKTPRDFVSTADLKSEKIMMIELLKARPDYGFITQESENIVGKDENRNWIIDPLDGTTNFLNGIPYFCVSIALEEFGEITTCVVLNPITDELFYAEKGFGAFLAGTRAEERLRVSSKKAMELALFGTYPMWEGNDIDSHLRLYNKVVPKVSNVREMGSCGLDFANLASGKLDGYFCLGYKKWHIAAGILLVKEAGGSVSLIGQKDIRTFDGKSVLNGTKVIASNSALHEKAHNIING